MGQERKKSLRLFLKKLSVKLIVSVQSSSLGEFFVDMPLQCSYITQLKYFQKYTFYQGGGKMWGGVVVRWKLVIVYRICPSSKKDMKNCVFISLLLQWPIEDHKIRISNSYYSSCVMKITITMHDLYFGFKL